MVIFGKANWQRIRVEPTRRYIVGVDIGQSMDPTAICVLEHSVEPTGDCSIQYGTLTSKGVVQEKAEVRYDVRHLERIPLGTPYPEVAAYVRTLLVRPPLHDRADLVLDETGVGRAVADIFEDQGMSPVRVAITAGNDVTDQGHNRFHVPKSTLISAVDAKLHVGELRFAAELTDAGALAEELKDFQRKVTASGRNTFGAREGKHDDLILSVAIALWWAMQKSVSPTTAPIDGFY
ncbi:hypothetical protein [Rhizobium sp.]